VQEGRIVAYDRERAGERLAGALILGSELLRSSAGPVVVTPRPAISRLNMMKLAEKWGFAERVTDPYRANDFG